MNKTPYRQQLKKGISDILIPYFQDLGFSQQPSRQVSIFGDSKRLYPLDCLVRFSKDGVMDIIEFKFGKNKNSGFEIHFAQIPLVGAYYDFGFAPQDETSAYGFGDFGVYQKSLFFIFQKFCSYTFEVFASRKIKKDLASALKHANEIETWFKSGLVGHRLRTSEKIGKGVTINRGWPKFFVFREVFAGYMTPPKKDRIFFCRKDVEEFALKELFSQNRKIQFGTFLFFKQIKH